MVGIRCPISLRVGIGFEHYVASTSLLLAGLLETQEARVRRAYRAQGFRLARRLVRGDWSILWLRKSRVR